MKARVRTAYGVYLVDVAADEVLGLDADATMPEPEGDRIGLPGVVASSAAGSTVVAVVSRRPPLVVSYDAGRTWQETGGGLPEGRAVAIAADDPDLMLFAGRNRLFVSRDGGRFWQARTLELPEIDAVAWI